MPAFASPKGGFQKSAVSCPLGTRPAFSGKGKHAQDCPRD